MSRTICLALVGLTFSAAVRAADDAPAVYTPATLDSARTAALKWATDRTAPEPALTEINQLFAPAAENSSAPALDVLDRVVAAFGLVDAPTRDFILALDLPTAPLVPPTAVVLQSEGLDPFYAANIRLYYARYLTHRRMYEEALDVFAASNPQAVVDPAAYFFYKATCEKALQQKDAGLKTLDLLLKQTERVPVRYSTVATLMQYDLQALQAKSLDEISGKMEDVERRLDLARPGQKTQKVEGEIVALLDEIIKKIEEQQGGGGGGGGGGKDGQSKSNQSSSPAGDSKVKGSTAPGEVDRKQFKDIGKWGDLNDKERARVKNLIARDFPAHYRKAVEEYFRKLANREAEKK